MALHPRFTQTHPDLDAFLHSQIGENSAGLMITVASALARSGLDPWKEAARLASLTPAAAARVLAPVIARTSGVADEGDALAAADRLIRLLPAREEAARHDRRADANTTRSSKAAIWLLCLALVLAVLVWTTRGSEPSEGEDPTGTPWSAEIPSKS